MKKFNIVDKLKVLRPLFMNRAYDRFGMPVMEKFSEDALDFNILQPMNIQNLSKKTASPEKLVLSFRYDKNLLKYWNNPLRYVPLFQQVMAVCTPDFSIYPFMHPIELEHNVFMNRWLGCLWQDYGCKVIPTVSWALPDSYDVCFSGLSTNTVVAISTLGCMNCINEFMMGYKEMLMRINPSLIIVFGNIFPGMYGKIFNIAYHDAFEKRLPYNDKSVFSDTIAIDKKAGA